MPTSAKPLSIVTGANSGIGREVTAGLMGAGHHVIMACRSAERCARAKADLDGRGLAGSCECAQLNLSDYRSVRRFVDAAFPPGCSGPGASRSGSCSDGQRRLDILVNNAALMAGENLMRTNHFSPFLLTRLLLPHMVAGGRVVNVASEAHRRGNLQLQANGSLGPQPSHWYRAYARTKLANLLFTAELSRRLLARNSTVTAYGVSPGRVATNIFHGVPGLLRRPLEWLARAAFQTPARGAQGVLRAALAPELNGRHEVYSHKLQGARSPSAAACDPVLAAALWELSCSETGLSTTEDARLWPPA